MSFTVRAYCQWSGDIRLLILPASTFFFFIFGVYIGNEACILKQSKGHTPYYQSSQENTFLSSSDNDALALREPMQFSLFINHKVGVRWRTPVYMHQVLFLGHIWNGNRDVRKNQFKFLGDVKASLESFLFFHLWHFYWKSQSWIHKGKPWKRRLMRKVHRAITFWWPWPPLQSESD